MTKWEINDLLHIVAVYGEGHTNTLPNVKHLYKRIEDVELLSSYFYRIIESKRVRECLEFLTKVGVMDVLIYDFHKIYNMEQPKKYHIKDVFNHTVDVVERGASLDHKIAGLLHDIGKIYTYSYDEKSGVHFYGHQEYSYIIAKKFLKKINYDNNSIKKILYAVKFHMTWKDASLNHKTIIKYINNYGKDNVIFFIELAINDSNRQNSQSTKHLYEYIEFVKQYTPPKIKKLPFGGKDIMDVYNVKGKLVGKLKNMLIDNFENVENVTYEMCKSYLDIKIKDIRGE